MPRIMLQKDCTSRLNLYLDDIHPVGYLWDIVVQESSPGMVFTTINAAVDYARNHNLPIKLITASAGNFKIVTDLMEKAHVTLVVEGAPETTEKNYPKNGWR